MATDLIATHPAAQSDESTLARYRDAGDPADFQTLVHRYERELYRYLTRYLANPVLAEDVCQNTFLQVHLKRALYEDGRPVRPWLYAIATHQAVDALRKAGRHPTVSLDRQGAGDPDGKAGGLLDLLVSDGQTPLAAMQGQEQRELVAACVDRLPVGLRQTVMLAYGENLKYREIADILKIPVGTVKSRLHAGMARLGRMVRAADAGPDWVAR